MVSYHYEAVHWRLPNPSEVSAWLLEIAQRHRREIGELNFLFANDEHIRYLNQKYLQHDYYTDILTFDFTADFAFPLLRDEVTADEPPLYVDIYISLDRIQENATELDIPWLDELHRVMVHGLLHTLGFNDDSDANQTQMRKQEDIALGLRMF